MNFVEAIQSCFKNYVKCSGDAARSPRSEYWYWFLFTLLATIVAMILDSIIFHAPVGDKTVFHPLYTLTGLAFILPSINVGIRRLHDIDRSGWWLLIGLIPLIGSIVLLVFFCTKGTYGPNRFGADPLQPTSL